MVWSGYSDGDIRRQTQDVIGEKGPGLAQRALYAILEVWNLPLSGNGPQETQRVSERRQGQWGLTGGMDLREVSQDLVVY